MLQRTSGKFVEARFEESITGVEVRRETEMLEGKERQRLEKLAIAFVLVRKSAPRMQSLARLSTTKTGKSC